MCAAVWKWCKRGLWGLLALFILYWLVLLTDFIWYHTQVPIGFSNANWSGHWKTEQIGLSGRLLVKLPEPLPIDEDFQAEALVYYPIYSGWRMGQFVKMDFKGRFTPDNPSSSGQNSNEIPGAGGGMLKFKGVAGNQVVEYAALINPRQTRIVGGYLSKSPDDYGSFSIRYY